MLRPSSGRCRSAWDLQHIPALALTMASVILGLLKVCIVLLLLSMSSGASAQSSTTQETWCVPKPGASDAALKENIAFGCSAFDCSMIQKGGLCFDPDTLMAHAAVVMNLYYQSHGRNPWNCDFSGSGLIAITDPSHVPCVFAV